MYRFCLSLAEVESGNADNLKSTPALMTFKFRGMSFE
jgi:hypothetical protein